MSDGNYEDRGSLPIPYRGVSKNRVLGSDRVDSPSMGSPESGEHPGHSR